MGNCVEILAGNGFANAVKAFGAKAEKKWENDKYEVWSIEADDLRRMDVYPDVYWRNEWGWWRSAEGTNIEHYPTHVFTVKGKELLGWYDQQRLTDLLNDDDYTEDEYFETTYTNLTSYLCEVLGVGLERNVCAVAIGLAKLNRITMAELFERYE